MTDYTVTQTPLEKAARLLDDSAQTPNDKALWIRAAEAATRAGMITRKRCWSCKGATDTRPMWYPGTAAIDADFMCEECSSSFSHAGRGRAKL